MARALSLIALGLLFSLPSTSAVRTKVPGDEPSGPDSALTAGSPTRGNHGVGGFAEAHCNRLTVRGGLQEKEAVKVTANGWGKGDADFFVELVTDNTRGMLQIRESQTEAGPGLAGGGGQEGGSTEGSKTDEGPVKEQPSIPIVGVRIPGSANENGESRKPAVLVYGEGESAPKEFPLDSPAGPTSPFMVVLQQKSPTEMTVRLFTWIPNGSGGDGSWHETFVDVGVGINHRDVMVVVSDCVPHSLRIYGSSSADLVTGDEKTCQATEPQLVNLTSPPENRTHPGAETSTTTSVSS
ncbi:Microneme protein etmic-2/7h, related [Eimeria maxima]|uniref:Microneme protein etmic-2/7h, related n=1 Tax=Eimeria maxima TaxID=5804 RepID=U6MCD1_EIMMA|nr:Microneme protein etmic-2/7h, related [Eimeria maxima]CDJ60099.1 Microneme protein etmic-2/7h, related [Eimeria maxima]